MYIDPSNLTGPAQQSAASSPNRSDDPIQKLGQADQSRLRQQYAAILNQALQTDSSDPEAVKEAKKALESGLLDSPQAAIEAAQALVKYGI